ncbi:hypothetical protein JW979_00740 [bacterium]|nr:hypothetical protein [candidate division CSSED10-310 bacterium]
MNARGSGIGARTSGISARVATELTALAAGICRSAQQGHYSGISKAKR